MTALAEIGTSTSTTRVCVDPPEIVDRTGAISEFSVGVNITDAVEEVYSWSIWLNFNPLIVNVADTPMDIVMRLMTSSWLSSASGHTAIPLMPVVENDLGYVFVGEYLDVDEPNGATGNGTLITINFTVTDEGITALDLDPTKLNTVIAGNSVPILHVAENGVFDNRVENEPPVADFYAEPLVAEVNETITFNASASYDPDSWLVSYAWDFGDGTTEFYVEGVNLTIPHITTHAYDALGTYVVTLTVTDYYDGATANATEYIAVGHDIAITNVVPSPIEVVKPNPVSINVTVENEGYFNETFDVTVYYNVTAVDTKTGIFLENGTSTTLTFTWDTTPVEGGNYTIKAEAVVAVDDDPSDNLFTDGTVTLLSPPVADFTWTSLVVGIPVNFTSTSYDLDGAIISWEWDLDGNGILDAFTENTTYTYTTEGDYNVTLTVTDNHGLNSTKTVTLTVFLGVVHDVAITSVTPSATEVVLGKEVTITVVAKNKGSETETFNVTAYYDNTAIGIQSVNNLPSGSNTTLTFTWNTTDVAKGTYTIKAEASVVPDEINTDDNTFVDGTVQVRGATLDIAMDVGSIHFKGEIAEFYILVSLLGEPTDAEISATLYYSEGTSYEDLSASVERVAAGFYRVPYTIPTDAQPGTYVLVVKASYLALKGASLKSFLLNPTLTGWNALLININGAVGTIKTDVGLIRVKLDAVDATLVSVEGNIATISSNIGLIQTDISTINAKLTAINGTLATIQTDIGLIQADVDDIQLEVTEIHGNTATIQTTLGTIEGTITSIEGDMATIETDVGTVQADISKVKGAQESFTTPLYIAIIPALIAAIGAILAIVFIRRKTKT